MEELKGGREKVGEEREDQEEAEGVVAKRQE